MGTARLTEQGTKRQAQEERLPSTHTLRFHFYSLTRKERERERERTGGQALCACVGFEWRRGYASSWLICREELSLRLNAAVPFNSERDLRPGETKMEVASLRERVTRAPRQRKKKEEVSDCYIGVCSGSAGTALLTGDREVGSAWEEGGVARHRPDQRKKLIAQSDSRVVFLLSARSSDVRYHLFHYQYGFRVHRQAG